MPAHWFFQLAESRRDILQAAADLFHLADAVIISRTAEMGAELELEKLKATGDEVTKQVEDAVTLARLEWDVTVTQLKSENAVLMAEKASFEAKFAALSAEVAALKLKRR